MCVRPRRQKRKRFSVACAPVIAVVAAATIVFFLESVFDASGIYRGCVVRNERQQKEKGKTKRVRAFFSLVRRMYGMRDGARKKNRKRFPSRVHVVCGIADDDKAAPLFFRGSVFCDIPDLWRMRFLEKTRYTKGRRENERENGVFLLSSPPCACIKGREALFSFSCRRRRRRRRGKQKRTTKQKGKGTRKQCDLFLVDVERKKEKRRIRGKNVQ